MIKDRVQNSDHGALKVGLLGSEPKIIGISGAEHRKSLKQFQHLQSILVELCFGKLTVLVLLVCQVIRSV